MNTATRGATLELAQFEGYPSIRSLFSIAFRPSFWLCGAVVVGFLLRVHCLLFPYLWLDEYVTLWSIGGETYSEMLRRSTQWTASGPLFVLSYRASVDIFQNIEWGLKLPGVVGGTIAIWVAWWASRKLFDDEYVAIVTSWLVAFAPQFIHFSQEGRPYTIASLLLLGATGFLAGWIRSQSRKDLIAAAMLSVAAVGFHLFCALGLFAHNFAVLIAGLRHGWPLRRWAEWVVTQSSVAVAIWLGAGQLRSLNHRQGSMILDTALPMPTRLSLNDGFWGQLQVEMTIALVGVAFWFLGRRFPHSHLGKTWNQYKGPVCIAAGTYWIPCVVLTLLCGLRVIDGWPRYYFLFQSGIILALGWLVAGALPRTLSNVLLAVVMLGSASHFNCVYGVPSCRLNDAWKEFPVAERTLQQRFGKNDLVLSRSGLIESNHLMFLCDPVGASYLKAFCEARSGALAAEHWPLPFSVESSDTQKYVHQLFAEKVLCRTDFWVANIGTSDFDYNDWIAREFGAAFKKEEELIYPMITLTHYINDSPLSNQPSNRTSNLGDTSRR
jgi:hypothetical protein